MYKQNYGDQCLIVNKKDKTLPSCPPVFSLASPISTFQNPCHGTYVTNA